LTNYDFVMGGGNTASLTVFYHDRVFSHYFWNVLSNNAKPIFGVDNTTQLNQIKDGTSNTLAMFETTRAAALYGTAGIPWSYRPGDSGSYANWGVVPFGSNYGYYYCGGTSGYYYNNNPTVYTVAWSAANAANGCNMAINAWAYRPGNAPQLWFTGMP